MEQKVTVRLPPKLIEAIDRGIENGLAHNRSEVVRKTIEASINLAGADRESLSDFILQVLSEPLEYLFWITNRLNLFMLDDAEQRLYAGKMTTFIKAAGKMTGIGTDQDYGEVRQRILDAISNFKAPEGFSTATPDERIVQIMTSDAPLAPAADPPLDRGFDVFISRLTQRIKAGATAKEVAAKLGYFIHGAGVEAYYGAKDVDIGLRLMAEAADVASIMLDEDGQPDSTALADAYDTWTFSVPALYDNVNLREEVKEIILRDLGEAPSEESKTPQETSEIQDEESQSSEI